MSESNEVNGKLTLTEYMAEQAKKLSELTKQVAELKEEVESMRYKGDYISLKEYANVNRITLSKKQSVLIDLECTKRCGLQNFPVKRRPCPIFCQVNSYPVWVLEEILYLAGYI